MKWKNTILASEKDKYLYTQNSMKEDTEKPLNIFAENPPS